MRQKKKEKMIERMIEKLYEGLDFSNQQEAIRKDTLDKLVRNIAIEILNAKALSNQALY